MHPIVAAITKGNLELIHTLHEEGVNIFPSIHGDSPMHIAAKLGQSTIIRWYYQHGYSVNATNARGMSPITCSIYFHKYNTTRLLVDLGARMEFTSLCRAVNSNNGYAIELIVAFHPEWLDLLSTQQMPSWWAADGRCALSALTLRSLGCATGGNVTLNHIPEAIIEKSRFRAFFAVSLLRRLLYWMDPI